MREIIQAISIYIKLFYVPGTESNHEFILSVKDFKSLFGHYNIKETDIIESLENQVEELLDKNSLLQEQLNNQ